MRTYVSIFGPALLTLLVTLVSAEKALACSCLQKSYQGEYPELQALRDEDLVAAGIVTAIKPGQDGETTADLDLTTVWKGSFGPHIKAGFQKDTGGNCGLDLEPGSKILIQTNAEDPQSIYLSSCNSSMSDWINSQESHAIATRAIWERYRKEWQTLLDAAAKSPTESNKLFKLAAFLETNNDRLGALDSYQRIVALRPSDPKGHAGAARTSYALGRFADAVAFAKKAHELAPADREIERLYRRAQFQAGEAVDLATVDFRGIKISGKVLDGAKLAGKDFSRAELEDVSFRGAMLDRADFTNARLYSVDFSNASLRQADFRPNPTQMGSGPTLSASQFQGADLSGARFDGITLSIDSKWDGTGDPSSVATANLAGARLSCSGLDRYSLIAVSPDGLEPLWQKQIGDMQLVDQIRKQQPRVTLEAECAKAVTAYLALPMTCRPWRLEKSTHPYCSLPE